VRRHAAMERGMLFLPSARRVPVREKFKFE